jgi:hypothetical protein
VSITCPKCSADLDLLVEASLPEATDLTLTLTVEPGQFVRLDTIAGVLAEWRKLQIAVGKSMGARTEVFLTGLESVDHELRFKTRITNDAASKRKCP